MPLPTDRLEVKIAGYLRARERAARIGDVGLLRAIDADLKRIGYVVETAQAPAMEEAAVPPVKRRPGRPRKTPSRWTQPDGRQLHPRRSGCRPGVGF